MVDPAKQMKDRLRVELRAALRSKDAAAARALRSAIGAIDNAEAVPDDGRTASVGVSADVPRRVLSAEEVADLLRAEIEERRTAATSYRHLGQDDAATRLDHEITVLQPHLADIR